MTFLIICLLISIFGLIIYLLLPLKLSEVSASSPGKGARTTHSPKRRDDFPAGDVPKDVSLETFYDVPIYADASNLDADFPELRFLRPTYPDVESAFPGFDYDRPEYRNLASYSPELQTRLQDDETLAALLAYLKTEQLLEKHLAILRALEADPDVNYSSQFLDYLEDHPEYESKIQSPSLKQAIRELKEDRDRFKTRQRQILEGKASLDSLKTDPAYKDILTTAEMLQAELHRSESLDRRIDPKTPSDPEIARMFQKLDEARRENAEGERSCREARARLVYLKAVKAVEDDIGKTASEGDVDAAYWAAFDDTLLLHHLFRDDK
ncbi:MAG: hypothetical protein SPI65_06050 [Peptoniphilus sp.]|nr:hypothetical protein [Peptoniphilus sp.]MDY6045119.1 hypothetical protein [Peptoniphilus sp.]